MRDKSYKVCILLISYLAFTPILYAQSLFGAPPAAPSAPVQSATSTAVISPQEFKQRVNQLNQHTKSQAQAIYNQAAQSPNRPPPAPPEGPQEGAPTRPAPAPTTPVTTTPPITGQVPPSPSGATVTTSPKPAAPERPAQQTPIYSGFQTPPASPQPQQPTTTTVPTPPSGGWNIQY